ncbi:MAG: hypothetical protein JJU12_03705 [Chlamydiales bacterium]|nr:hypothetical protein [Chlamydiales bacterium]
MRLIFSLMTLASFGLGGWYAWDNIPQLREAAHHTLSKTEYRTLEIRYAAEELMRIHKDHFLKNNQYSYLEPQLLYYPYLLMDVKYTKDRSTTCEGTLLWGLTDGEMVINTATWEKTHGFEDCLLTKADKNDFKIIKALVENGGMIDREKLYQCFKVDHDILDDWIDSCRQKKLIVISGNQFRLHFADPRLEIQPSTHLDQALVSQPARPSAKVPRRYSPSQIMKLAEIVFGGDFAIRKTEEVFLPVYSVAIENPDGSTRTVYFNALSGKPTSPR